ncbi:hypothetical protein AOQ73_16230 [Bradyrhizobium pachyrhizi]|uniref:Transposase n=1 Tax=Bradyrhizobium brasilense TaxID=1419277 RepID=A0ABY8JIY5_9BRAD|nr:MULTISPECIES: hypothetical protein [Bradyrhizobium]KRQ04459.1 hypothetical protein AOQ73_16230 [Bradyrhizobium pachyrhizi]OMI11456.1 hypothetical protein BSN85_12890 [Bradyrhizobium brasilense]WFU65574.1 hypothetical protein QA636_08660 [Bradyrhizobium brasilense]
MMRLALAAERSSFGSSDKARRALFEKALSVTTRYPARLSVNTKSLAMMTSRCGFWWPKVA